jgi:DHA2 family multidrug resistance protein
VAYLTLPRELNGDGAALFAMFRNVFGSIGISLSTAEITQRSQIHQTYLSQWASPFHQPYQALIATYEQTLRAMGRAGAAVQDVAIGRIYQMFRIQATVLAYSDVFYYCAIVAFVMVPFCFLLSPKTGGGAGGAH